jgi:hypothetical protein
MGNRRMGAQRLVAMQKRGATGLDTSSQAGAGIKNAVVSHRMTKYGRIIETEICVDLQGKDSISIFSSTADNDYVGEATAADGTGAVEGVHLLKWSDATHGQLFDYEIIIAELPTGGADDLELSFDTFGAAHKQTTNQAGTQLILVDQTDAWVLGDRHTVDVDGATTAAPIAAIADIDGDGLYLSTGESGTAAAY